MPDAFLAAWPTELSLHLRYLTPWTAAAWFALLAAITIAVGWRSLKWLGPGRQWSIIGFRLVLLYTLILILAGAEAVRTSDDLEVVVLRDVSASTEAVVTPGKQPLEAVTDDALRQSVRDKPLADRVGVVGFDAAAWVDSLPQTQLRLDARSVRAPESGTDLASAIRLGMVCFRGDAMKKLVLVSDGNATQGNLDSALEAAAGAKVPVDVVPLRYSIRDEVMVDRLVGPVWRRQGEPFHLDAVIRSAGLRPVSGRLKVTHGGIPIDLDPATPGIQATRPATLKQGTNVLHVVVPPSSTDGVHRFKAHFIVDAPAGGTNAGGGDTLGGNNSAESFTFVRGRGRILLVDNYPPGEGDDLVSALRAEGVGIEDADRITPDRFPSQLIDLQSFDAVILANVPRGPGGISDEQGQLLGRYVKDTGGGLLMIGGPDSFGAGGWQGSELEKVLPVNLEIPAERALPSGALVLVIDHSGSMSGPMDQTGSTFKMESAKQSAILATKTMLAGDYLGVVIFDDLAETILPLGPNRGNAADVIRTVEPAGGTNIFVGLDEAEKALAKLSPREAAAKHILLLTDGQSDASRFPEVLARIKQNKITLSTIAVGTDADVALLDDLAKKGGGRSYTVTDPTRLTQVFLREARTVRRNLIQESLPPASGIPVAQTPGAAELLAGLAGQPFPPLGGMVLTSRRQDPQVQTALVSTSKFQDPILASWQIGLGKVAVYTGDATRRWSANLVSSPQYSKLWTQLVRTVSRAPMSGDFDVRTERDGAYTKVIVEALADRGVQNGLSIAGTVAGPNPDRAPRELRLTQTGPGRYEDRFPTPDGGAYVTALQYRGPQGQRGTLLAGLTADDAPERRDLTSNEAKLEEIARRTGGRVLPALGTAASYDLFTRTGVAPARAFLPLNWLLLPLAAALLILDVAIRRLQIDRAALAAAWRGAGNFVRSWTTVRKADGTQAVDALRKIRQQGDPQTTSASTTAGGGTAASSAPAGRPNPKAKFDSKTSVAGDITQVVGGAKDEPMRRPAPGTSSVPAPAGEKADTTSSLLAAKRRAQQRMNDNP
ncbi:MAG TPA: VWA domain-containing protein [Tepidisphaeraceae bacterium]|jgi:uncharacterized membrane protein